jgi:predicted acetyltransferase
MNIEIKQVFYEQKFILQNLIELNKYDLSQYEDDGGVNEYGLFGYRYLDHYWTESGRHPFFIRVDHRLAGFVLVSDLKHLSEREIAHSASLSFSEVTHCITEFFVMRNYRCQGIGRTVAKRIFDMFPGKWRVSQMEKNIPSQEFWRRVISEYTDGEYTETLFENRPVQEFFSKTDKKR